MKISPRPVIVLTAICLVVAAILAAVNDFTAPIIEKNAENARMESLKAVIPDAGDFTELAFSDAPETVQRVYEENGGKGWVVILSTTSQYSSDNMGITVGIGADGKISGVKLTSYYESKDFGKDSYPATYIGEDASLAGTELVSGVTYSSTAFRSAIADAFTALRSLGRIS